MERVSIVKQALLAEIRAHMASLPACRNLRVGDVVHDPLRSHGGNWATQGMHRSGSDHAEFECQKAMADFMTEMHERFDIVE
jgi:hypothetical protein